MISRRGWGERGSGVLGEGNVAKEDITTEWGGGQARWNGENYC